MVFFYIAVCVGRFVATDIFGGLLSAIMATIAWYMVTDDGAKMSQYCILLFGFMCMINGVLEFVTLASCLPGRVQSRTQSAPLATTNSATSRFAYTVTVEKHPFFDNQAGWVYNHQSAMMIVCPVSAFLGALLAYYTYNAFPNSLFEEDDGFGAGAGPQNWGGGRLGGGGGFGGGGFGNGGNGGGGAAPRTQQPAYTTFGGSGHRLGS